MADLNGAVEKLKQMMSTDEGQANIQNILSNFNAGDMDMGNLGSLFGSGAASPNISGNSDSSAAPGGIDMDAMLKMQKMFSMMNSSGGNNSRHSAMLHSLKPYLSDGRKSKLDMAAKLMSLAKFAPLFKDMM